MFIAIVTNYWGRGETKEAAIKAASRAGFGRITKKTQMVVYRTEDPEPEADCIDGSLRVRFGTAWETVERRNLPPLPTNGKLRSSNVTTKRGASQNVR